MEFSELAELRQSNRKYDAERPVEREKLERCIETARLSASSNNSQPWHFIVIDDAAKKKEIEGYAAGFGGMNKFAAQAPVIVAVVLEKPNFLSAMGSVIQDKEYSLLDMGIAVNQFCLQAADLGLGTCMIGWFNEKAIKKALGVPKRLRLPLIITVGYAADKHREKIRKATAEMSSWNEYK